MVATVAATALQPHLNHAHAGFRPRRDSIKTKAQPLSMKYMDLSAELGRSSRGCLNAYLHLALSSTCTHKLSRHRALMDVHVYGFMLPALVRWCAYFNLYEGTRS